MKKIKILLMFVFSIIIFTSCISSKDFDKKQQELYEDSINVNIEIQNYGTMELELYPNLAPITVDNFVSLVKSGFYNGSSFNRIISGFMIQGGAPSGNVSGGSGKTIKGEFKANGVSNPLKHERGVISMARRGGTDYDSASSQFFIVHKTYPSLDGHYAAFGRVTKGIEIVDKICKDTKVEDSNGTVLKENHPIITRIYLKEGN